MSKLGFQAYTTESYERLTEWEYVAAGTAGFNTSVAAWQRVLRGVGVAPDREKIVVLMSSGVKRKRDYPAAHIFNGEHVRARLRAFSEDGLCDWSWMVNGQQQ